MKAFLMLCLGLFLGAGCGDEEGDCTIIRGREVDLERDCNVGIVEIACVEVDHVFALSGHECRVSDDGKVFVQFSAPAYFELDGYTPCPDEMGVTTLGGYTEPCPAELGE